MNHAFMRIIDAACGGVCFSGTKKAAKELSLAARLTFHPPDGDREDFKSRSSASLGFPRFALSRV